MAFLPFLFVVCGLVRRINPPPIIKPEIYREKGGFINQRLLHYVYPISTAEVSVYRIIFTTVLHFDL